MLIRRTTRWAGSPRRGELGGTRSRPMPLEKWRTLRRCWQSPTSWGGSVLPRDEIRRWWRCVASTSAQGRVRAAPDCAACGACEGVDANRRTARRTSEGRRWLTPADRRS
jgi:hypothetical protein